MTFQTFQLPQSVMKKPHVKRILLEEHFYSIGEHGLQLSLCSFDSQENISISLNNNLNIFHVPSVTKMHKNFVHRMMESVSPGS